MKEQDLLESLSPDVVNLGDSKFNMPVDALSSSVGQAEKEAIIDTLSPKEIPVDTSQKVDIKTQGNIAINLKEKKLFLGDLLDLEEEDSEAIVDPLKVVTPKSSLFDVEAMKNTLKPHRGTGPIEEFKKLDITGKTEEEVKEELEKDLGVTQNLEMPNLGELYDPAKNYVTDLYGNVKDYIGDFFDPKGIETIKTPSLPSYTAAIPTGLGTTTSQSAIGVSGPPPASLAGQQAGDITNISGIATSGAAAFANIGLAVPAATQTGLSTFTTVGAAGTPSFQTGLAGQQATRSGLLKTAGQAASLYGIYSGIKQKDYFSAGASLIALINPATAVPLAVLQGVKLLFQGFFGGSKPKPAFGGADIAATSNKLVATAGYGYNAYRKESGQAVVASVADYVNQYVKKFGLQFNGNRWQHFLKKNPRMERYDTTGETGYNDPSTMTRAIFETKGLITGNPTYNGMSISSQKDYQEKIEEFNKWYQDTAYKSGGLVDPVSVGINTPLSGEYTTVQTRRDSGRPDPNSPKDYHGRHTRNIVLYGERPATLYEMLHKNLTGSYHVI
jgi:hypothetical protein